MRTKGATSNVYVPLHVLNGLFNPNALIPVARRFCDENQIRGQPFMATKDNLKAAGNPPAIEEKVSINEIEPEEPVQLREPE